MPAARTIAIAAKELAERRTNAATLVDDALQRINAKDGEGARTFTRVYAESARIEASVSDMLRSAGRSRSPIDGIPISVKDLFDIGGESTTAGSTVLRGASPAAQDAMVVRRLRAAGAIVVGRTNMTEFAYSGLGLNPHYGTPRNPWERHVGRIPGGSSSGAAISVTDGMSYAGIGSDTGGSVRIPAALCGLVGFKPTARRVSMDGVLPLSTHLDSIGPIGRSVACCTLLDAILAGESSPAQASHPLSGLRLLVPTTVVQDHMDAAVAAAFHGALNRLAAAGVRLVEKTIPAFSRLSDINAKGGFTAAEAWAWHRHLIGQSHDQYDPRVVSRIMRGKDMTAADLIDVIKARSGWIREVEEAVCGYDAMIMPTVPIVAPSIAELEASDEAYFRANGLMLRNPTFINFLDGCALSIPCHPDGAAPVGLMIAGTAMTDKTILSIGSAIERQLSD